MNNAGNTINVAINNSTFFKYKAIILVIATVAVGNDRSLKKCKNSHSVEICI